MGLTRRHFAVSLVDRDGHLKCPGGGTEHPLAINGRLVGESHGWFVCATCTKNVFLLQLKYGLVNIGEIDPQEVATREREEMGFRQILKSLTRGAKRLDRV